MTNQPADEIAVAKPRSRGTSTDATQRPAMTKGMEARQRIIAVAETLFTQRGFDGTSMRDIATAAHLQAASMYYHFPSKEELLWAVWEKGGLELLARAKAAVEGKTDPWARMESACVAHVTGLLDWRRANQLLFVMPPWQYPAGMRDRVVALRDQYERVFAELIDALPLRPGVDRHQLRLMLIGALSWSLYWYRPEGGDAPAAIARSMLDMVRGGVEPAAKRRGTATTTASQPASKAPRATKRRAG